MDIKGDNIRLFGNIFKLADFGLAIQLQGRQFFRSNAGTLGY